jgi:hypothetical protein
VVVVILFETLALQFSSSLHAASSELSLLAQGGRSVPVTVQPPAAIQIVLFSAGADGKALTTTDQSGKGSFDSSALTNLGNLAITEETCAKGRRVLLVASNAKAPQNRECKTTQLGTFVGSKDVVLNVTLSGSFTAAIGAVPIPEPTPAKPSTPPVQRAESVASTQKPTPVVTSAAAGSCPPGAGMIGPKLDLPEGGKTFEEATALAECTYRGLKDTEGGQWRYFKVSVGNGQTLKVTARTRDSNIGRGNYLYLRLHGPDGGRIGERESNQYSTIFELEYKAKESGFAYLAVADVVGEAAFRISIQ